MVVSTVTRNTNTIGNLSLSSEKLNSPLKYSEVQIPFDSPVGPSSSPSVSPRNIKLSSIHDSAISVINSMHNSISPDLESPEKQRQKMPLLKGVSLDSIDELSDSEPSSPKTLVDIELAVPEIKVTANTTVKLPLNLRLLHSIRTMTWQTGLRITALAILIIGIATFLGFLVGSNRVQTSMVSVLEWLSHLPKWAGSLVMIGMYTGGLMLFCPGTPFNLAAGFLFGIWIGIGVAMAGCMFGAGFAFLLGRTIARDWIKSKMEQRPKFRAIDWAIQKNGLYIIFLTRLSPLFPFPLLNYGFGITKVAIWQYVAGTFAGVVPATIAYTYIGTLMRDLTDIWTATDVEGGNKTNLYWLVGGAVMTVVSIVVISFITKRAITKATREYELQHAIKTETEVPVDNLQPPPQVELEEVVSE